MQIQAAVLERADGILLKNEIKIESVELEAPRAGEALIRVTSCGVCGTDRGCLHGLEPYPTPGVLGHEAAGIVEETGRDVTLVKTGDRVIVSFPFDGTCRNCRAGNPRYCLHGHELMFSGYRLDGSTPLARANGEKLAGRFFQQSSWATFAVVTEQQLAIVPEGCDHDLFGPLGCSITTGAGAILEELCPRPGSSIAVFGAGAVGLSAIMAARLTGATTIIAVDKEQNRLDLARDLGATHTLESGSNLAAQIKEITKGGADYAIESTNGANLVAKACESLGILGVCAMVGGAKQTAEVDLNHSDMMLNGKRLVGVMGGSTRTPSFHQTLMRLQAQGRFPLEKLVRYYDFADINQAIKDSDSGAVVKPILRMQ